MTCCTSSSTGFTSSSGGLASLSSGGASTASIVGLGVAELGEALDRDALLDDEHVVARAAVERGAAGRARKKAPRTRRGAPGRATM